MPLTPRQTSVLHAIRRLTVQAGNAPTVRELAAFTGMTHQRVHQHLNALRQRGAITWKNGCPRTLRVVAACLDCETANV